jgi:hypothetical protein
MITSLAERTSGVGVCNKVSVHVEALVYYVAINTSECHGELEPCTLLLLLRGNTVMIKEVVPMEAARARSASPHIQRT